MASAAIAERFCHMTENHRLYLFGLILENRAYMNFVACLLLIINACLVWGLYRYKKTLS